MWSGNGLDSTRKYHFEHGITGAILTLLISAFAAILLRRLWTAKNSGVAKPPLPPGPRGLPFFGYLPFLGADLNHEFSKLASVYGPIYKMWLGSKLCIVISSPSMVKEVVRDHDTVFANRDPVVSTLVCTYGGNDIVFSPYGPQWKKLRKIFVREMLSKTILDNLYGLRREEVHKSMKQIYEKANTPIDVGSLAFLTVINASTSMLCGASRRPGGYQKAGEAIDIAEIRKAATQLMELIGKTNISDLFPSLAWLDLQGVERETKKIVRVFEKLLDSAIQQARNAKAEANKDNINGDEEKDFLQFLLELHENGDESTSITMDQVKALLTDIVVGGTDTTTTTVEWTMTELLKHPEIMNKVKEELTQVVGLNNIVEESHLSQLIYLNAVIKETLRLHPPLPFLLPRLPSLTTTIGGYNVPKNARVLLNIGAIQRDPSYWENPLEFRPERFINRDEDSKFDYSGNNFHFLPFGSGRRVCAGLPIVERMLIYVIASFLHSFEWKLPPGTKLELSEKFGIVLKKLDPLIAIPTPRLCNLELYE